MNWILIVLQVIPIATRLMVAAEGLFDSVEDSGAQKKAYVMEAVKATVDGLSGFTGSPELWAKIEAGISPMIDILCLVLFKEKA